MRCAALVCLCLPWTAAAQVPGQGEMLYQNHCTACHESTVHVRERTRVGSLADIEAYVQRWSSYLELGWSAAERDAVRDYLNQSFYGFFDTEPPPPPRP
jgi:mono/diheme cytochrome c family protein